MKIYNQTGSKERLLEIFQNVNKIKINEGIAGGDPTKEEMIDFLMQEYRNDYDEFSAEEAIYWYGYDYHGGQNSNLYSALSTSQYKPSRLMNNSMELEGKGEMMYNDLVSHYEGGQLIDKQPYDKDLPPNYDEDLDPNGKYRNESDLTNEDSNLNEFGSKNLPENGDALFELRRYLRSNQTTYNVSRNDMLKFEKALEIAWDNQY
jgi:hypothetical protein